MVGLLCVCVCVCGALHLEYITLGLVYRMYFHDTHKNKFWLGLSGQLADICFHSISAISMCFLILMFSTVNHRYSHTFVIASPSLILQRREQLHRGGWCRETAGGGQTGQAEGRSSVLDRLG